MIDGYGPTGMPRVVREDDDCPFQHISGRRRQEKVTTKAELRAQYLAIKAEERKERLKMVIATNKKGVPSYWLAFDPVTWKEIAEPVRWATEGNVPEEANLSAFMDHMDGLSSGGSPGDTDSVEADGDS